MQGGFRILQPHLVFYFSINKPPSFFFFFFFWGGENTSCIQKPQVILKEGGGRQPRHPPPRSFPWGVHVHTSSSSLSASFGLSRDSSNYSFLHRSFFISAITIETLSGGRGRDLSLIFFAYSQKIQPRKASLYFFHQKSKHSYFYWRRF